MNIHKFQKNPCFRGVISCATVWRRCCTKQTPYIHLFWHNSSTFRSLVFDISFISHEKCTHTHIRSNWINRLPDALAILFWLFVAHTSVAFTSLVRVSSSLLFFFFFSVNMCRCCSFFGCLCFDYIVVVVGHVCFSLEQIIFYAT